MGVPRNSEKIPTQCRAGYFPLLIVIVVVVAPIVTPLPITHNSKVTLNELGAKFTKLMWVRLELGGGFVVKVGRPMGSGIVDIADNAAHNETTA